MLPIMAQHHEQEQDIAKTLESFVPAESIHIDSGYGDSGCRDDSSDPSELDVAMGKLLSLEQTIENQNNQQIESRQFEDFVHSNILPAFNMDADGDTCLHIFLAQLRLQEAQQIIHFCPDSKLLNITNRLGLSALHISVLMNLEEEVKLLICKNANMDLVDSEGNNIFHICAEKGHSKSLCSILDICDQRGELDHVLSLCQKTNYKGWTPFFTAAVNRNKDVCKLLVSNVADIDVNAGDIKTGNSPLHEAVMAKNNIDFIYFLLQDCNLDVNFRNHQNIAPLHIAATIEDEAICAILLKYNAQRDVRDDNGNIPAAYAANERILQYLKS